MSRYMNSHSSMSQGFCFGYSSYFTTTIKSNYSNSFIVLLFPYKIFLFLVVIKECNMKMKQSFLNTAFFRQ
jgi:hypothetical protein